MLATTLAMAPIYSLRLTSRNKTNRAAQAAAFELVCRAAHNLRLHFALRLAGAWRKKPAAFSGLFALRS